MGYISTISINSNDLYLIEPQLFATAGGTSTALTAGINNFELVAGAYVNVKVGDVGANATLNVNNTGAKAIYYSDTPIKDNILSTDHIYTFIYDGTLWNIVGDITTSDLNSYLPLSGGIMTGNIRRHYNTANTEPMITMLSNNLDIILWEAGHGTTAATTTTSNHYKLLYKGTGGDGTNSNYLQLIAHKSSDVIAVQIDEIGKVILPQMATGAENTPIYIDSNGVITAGTTLGTAAYLASGDFAAAGHNHDSAYSAIHQTSWNWAENGTKPLSKYVTFDTKSENGNAIQAPDAGWYNGFVTSHNNYLASFILNAHRSDKWYVGYEQYQSNGLPYTAPAWYLLAHSGNIFTGDANGQVKIAGKNVDVKGLKSLAYKDNLVASDIPDISETYATNGLVDGLLAAANAMTFKGTLGTGGTVTALPASHLAGDTYRVITEGEWAGKYCEVGTLIICVKDGETDVSTDWTSVETNEDGAVIGPASSAENNIATFSGTTGRIILDSEKAFSTATPSNSSTDDLIPTAKAVWAAIDALDGNLNSTTPGAGKTLTAFSLTNGKVSATFDDISITKSLVSDFAHAHGNLTNDGKITSTATIANGDKLVIVDSDASSKIIGATITFDGTTETKALTPKGTWVTFNNYSHPTNAGNKHIPSGGDTDLFLKYGGSSGTAVWSDLPVASTSTAGIIKIGTAATNAMAGNTVVNTVKQSPAPTSNNDEYPILLKTTANTNEETGTIKFSEPTITPKTGRLSATSFMVDSHVALQWNSTDSSLDFIFA